MLATPGDRCGSGRSTDERTAAMEKTGRSSPRIRLLACESGSTASRCCADADDASIDSLEQGGAAAVFARRVSSSANGSAARRLTVVGSLCLLALLACVALLWRLANPAGSHSPLVLARVTTEPAFATAAETLHVDTALATAAVLPSSHPAASNTTQTAATPPTTAASAEQSEAELAAAYPCVAFELSAHFPMLYQLAYDFDAVMNEAEVTYALADGSLLGALRHGGIIPFDDDLDVNLFCEEGSPCWGELFNPHSSLREHLRARGLELYTQLKPDSRRHLLKVYPTRPGHFIGRTAAGYTFPYLDIFLLTRLRCNVSDSLHAGTWKSYIAAAHESDAKRAEVSQQLSIYETDVWVYRTAAPQRFSRGGCSVLDAQFPFVMPAEVFPLQRVPFGPEAGAPVQLAAPRLAARILHRDYYEWPTILYRSMHSHYAIELDDMARRDVLGSFAEAILAGKPVSLHSLRQSSFKPCHIDLNDVLSAQARAWMTRPAGPSHVEQRSTQEVMRAWRATRQT